MTPTPQLSRPKNSNGHLQFRPSFIWEKEIEDFVKENMSGYSLNVPCGASKLGDERLDIDPNLSMREAYDMFNKQLPYAPCTFDTVISDPPWKIGHYFRPRLFFELVRVCKVGGKIIYNATWIPQSKHTKLLNTFIRQSASFGNISIISVFEKISNCPEEVLAILDAPLDEVTKKVQELRKRVDKGEIDLSKYEKIADEFDAQTPQTKSDICQSFELDSDGKASLDANRNKLGETLRGDNQSKGGQCLEN